VCLYLDFNKEKYLRLFIPKVTFEIFCSHLAAIKAALALNSSSLLIEIAFSK